MADKRRHSCQHGPLHFGSGFSDKTVEMEAPRGELQPTVDPRTLPLSSGLELQVLEGEDAGQRFTLETCEAVLGRRCDSEENKAGWIMLRDATVARMHAVLEWRSETCGYRIERHSSSTPVFVDGRCVDQAALCCDSSVRLGEVTFKLGERRRGRGAAFPNGEAQPVDGSGRWFSRPEYSLEIMHGPERGRRIPLMSRALRGERELSLGRPGRRVNDIDIGDETVENAQARIHLTVAVSPW